MRLSLSGQRLLLALACLLAARHPAASAQQHTSDAPGLIEGPQNAGTPPAHPAALDTMNNDAVLRMHAAGLGDSIVVQAIAAQPGSYDTGPDALIRLKGAGLSDEVLAAMTAKGRRQITPQTGNSTGVNLADIKDIGVYYKDRDGRWQPIDPEIVHVQGGGFMKSTLSYGIIKPDQNGQVHGRESKLLLPRPIEFLVYAPEGAAISEYTLVRFRLNSKNREFRMLTGGVIHMHEGAERDEQPMSPTRVAPRTWSFVVDQNTPGGEYGVLPPETKNVTNAGRVYTFAISE